MDNFKLNHDILLAVLGVCDRSSAAVMLRTCRTIYEEGARYVLAGEVHIKEKGELSSLILFLTMSGEDTSRFRFLQRLTLSVGRIDKALAFRLRRAFDRMSHLYSLTIFETESLLHSRNDLYITISRIRSLRHLEMHDAEDLACRLVENLCVGLESLRLRYPEFILFDHGDPDDFESMDMIPFLKAITDKQLWRYHPVRLCKKVASTLQELDMACGEVLDPVSPKVTYPHMRRLVLEEDLPNVSPYLCNFPDLSHLSVTSRDPEENYFADSIETYTRCRQLNIIEHHKHQAWSHLQEYEGQLLGLYLIAPVHSIPRLILTSTVDRDYITLLGEVLNSAKPSHLDIDFLGSPLGSSPLDMPVLLRGPGCASLESLKMAITLDHLDKEIDIGLCMESLRSSLAPLPVSSLHLTLVTGPRIGPIIPFTDPATQPLLPVERTLDQFEPLAYARHVADTVPTMQDVTIRVRGPRQKKERAARLRRGEDGAMIVVNP